MFLWYRKSAKWEQIRENNQWRKNAAMLTYFFLNLIVTTLCLFLSLSSFISPLIKTWEVFSSVTRALLRFHFTSSPGQLYAKQISARPDSPCQLSLHPAGCLTMQSAAHLWPDRLHSQFYHKACNTVKDFIGEKSILESSPWYHFQTPPYREVVASVWLHWYRTDQSSCYSTHSYF